MLSSRDPNLAVIEAAVALRGLTQVVGPDGKIPVSCLAMQDLAQAVSEWLDYKVMMSPVFK